MNFSFKLPTEKEVIEAELIGLSIEKAEVDRMDYSRIDSVIDICKRVKSYARNKLIVTFGGYEYTPDEIYEIPEIRKYVSGLLIKYPYYFYFANNTDNNRFFLTLCLANDIKTYAPEECNDINGYIKTGKPISKIAINFEFSKGFMTPLLKAAIAYGIDVGDTPENIEKMATGMFPKPGCNDASIDLPEGIDMEKCIHAINEEFWKAFINTYGMQHKIEPDRVEIFLRESYEFQSLWIENKYQAHPVTDSRKNTTNLFLVNGMGHQILCPDCGATKIVAIINNPRPMFNLEKKVFIPNKDAYFCENIYPMDSAYVNSFPIPVTPLIDMWYCPICKKLHRFKYDKEIGLVYN
jgi:hypothetical protein